MWLISVLCFTSTIALTLYTATKPIHAASFDADFTAKCKTQWQSLKTTKIPHEDKQSYKFAKDIAPATDSNGYVLILPKNGLSLTAKAEPGKQTNAYSFWASFKCENDMLVHDHCRVGEYDDSALLYLTPRRYFDTSTDGKLSQSDGMVYGCHLMPSVASIKAEVVPRSNYLVWHGDNERECKRMEGSKWCGFQAGLLENGCLDELNSLQKSKLDVKADGSMIVKSKQNDKEILDVDVVCDAKKFIVKACRLSRDTTLKPGQYLKLKGFAYACPAESPGFTLEQLSSGTIGQIVPVQVGAEKPRELDGLQPLLPKKVDPSCEKEWDTLTQAGKRAFDTKGYVRILVPGVRVSTAHFYSGMWAQAECEQGKLILKQCRIGKDRPLPVGSAFKEDGYFYNCGPLKGNDPWTTIDTTITRRKNIAKGLKELFNI